MDILLFAYQNAFIVTPACVLARWISEKWGTGSVFPVAPAKLPASLTRSASGGIRKTNRRKILKARALYRQRHGLLTIEITYVHRNHSLFNFPVLPYLFRGNHSFLKSHLRSILISFAKISLVGGLSVLPLFTYNIAKTDRKDKRIIC